VRALLALIATGFVPGWLLSGVTHPRADSLHTLERVVVAIVLSVAATALGGMLLARLDLLAPGPIAAWTALSALGAGAWAWSRHCEWRAIAARARSDGVSLPGLASLVLIVGYGVAFAVRQQIDPWSSPQPAWNYLGDVFAMLDSGGLPTHTLDYGETFAFEANKLTWYLALSHWIALAGLRDAPWSIVHWQVPLVAAAFAASVVVFARTLTTRPLPALVGAAAVLMLPRMISKFAGLRGESAAFIALFALLWAVARIARGDRAAVALASVSAALLATTHLVPAAVAALACTALATTRLGLHGREAVPGVLRSLVAAAIAAVVVACAWWVAPQSPLTEQSGIAQPGQFEAFRGYDPAQAYLHLVFRGELDATVEPLRDPESTFLYFHPTYLLRELVERSALPHPLWPLAQWGWLLPLGLAAWAFAWRRKERPGHEWIGALPVVFGGLFALGLLFSYRYHTYLPAQHPMRREFPYLAVFYSLALAPITEALYDVMLRRSSAQLARAATAAFVAAMLLPIAHAGFTRWRDIPGMARTNADGRAALAWLRDHSEPEARLLMDGSAVGLLGAHTGRACISEGRAPYFQPANLRIALDSLADSRRFFRLRAEPSADEFLRDRRIDYVVTGSSALGSRPFAAEPLRLDPRRHPIAARFGEVEIHRITRE